MFGNWAIQTSTYFVHTQVFNIYVWSREITNYSLSNKFKDCFYLFFYFQTLTELNTEFKGKDQKGKETIYKTWENSFKLLTADMAIFTDFVI